jgi:hypothetical protein
VTGDLKLSWWLGESCAAPSQLDDVWKCVNDQLSRFRTVHLNSAFSAGEFGVVLPGGFSLRCGKAGADAYTKPILSEGLGGRFGVLFGDFNCERPMFNRRIPRE